MKYFLSISGEVTLNKYREFEQTVQFVFNHLPSECLNHHLASDVHISGIYHIYLVWRSRDSLHAFKSSKEFNLLKGAFQTLGVQSHTTEGKWADIQIFEFNENEN
jgi:hypothetical protein